MKYFSHQQPLYGLGWRLGLKSLSWVLVISVCFSGLSVGVANPIDEKPETEAHQEHPLKYSLERHHDLMQRAIQLSRKGAKKGGGPFGAVIVNEDGKILGEGYNRVSLNHDPTAHGEIMAIRDASRRIRGFDLKGAILYTSTYPCPMCFSAAHWAHIKTIYYANEPEDVAAVFDDQVLWCDIQHQTGLLQQTFAMPAFRADAQQAFQQWHQQMTDGAIKNYNPPE